MYEKIGNMASLLPSELDSNSTSYITSELTGESIQKKLKWTFTYKQMIDTNPIVLYIQHGSHRK